MHNSVQPSLQVSGSSFPRSWHAKLWTANERDFEDIPGLKLWSPTL